MVRGPSSVHTTSVQVGPKVMPTASSTASTWAAIASRVASGTRAGSTCPTSTYVRGSENFRVRQTTRCRPPSEKDSTLNWGPRWKRSTSTSPLAQGPRSPATARAGARSAADSIRRMPTLPTPSAGLAMQG